MDSGKVATGGALADWMATDSDDVDSYLDEYGGLVDDADEYRIDLLHGHVSRDRDLLRSFARVARTVTRSTDPTLAELVEQLVAIAEEATETGIGPGDTRNRRKVLIFSYYADTVDWIVEHLIERPKQTPDSRTIAGGSHRCPDRPAHRIRERWCGDSLPRPPTLPRVSKTTATTSWLPPTCSLRVSTCSRRARSSTMTCRGIRCGWCSATAVSTGSGHTTAG